MARSFVPILIFALAGAAAGFFEAAAPRQEAASAVPNKMMAFSAERARSSFDEGLDNPDVVSDMKITPSRKCGFCMGVSRVSIVSSRQPDGGASFFSHSVLYNIISRPIACVIFPRVASPCMYSRRSDTLTRSLLACRLPVYASSHPSPKVIRADELPRLRPLRSGERAIRRIFVGCVWGRGLQGSGSFVEDFIPGPLTPRSAPG